MTDNRFYSILQAVCLALIAVMAFVLFATPCQGKSVTNEALPPGMDKVTEFGCAVLEVKKEALHVVFAVAYENGDKTIMVFAIHPLTEQDEAVIECKDWMALMKAEMTKVKKLKTTLSRKLA